jgi:hypothetical protein
MFCLGNNPTVQDELIHLVAAGQLKVPIDSGFPFSTEGVRDMLRHVAGASSTGKNILHVVS